MERLWAEGASDGAVHVAQRQCLPAAAGSAVSRDAGSGTRHQCVCAHLLQEHRCRIRVVIESFMKYKVSLAFCPHIGCRVNTSAIAISSSLSFHASIFMCILHKKNAGWKRVKCA